MDLKTIDREQLQDRVITNARLITILNEKEKRILELEAALHDRNTDLDVIAEAYETIKAWANREWK